MIHDGRREVDVALALEAGGHDACDDVESVLGETSQNRRNAFTTLPFASEKKAD